MARPSNPGHWIWHAACPRRFVPDEHAYLVIRGAMSPRQVCEIEALIDEGMSAERIVCLFCFPAGGVPVEVEVMIGDALAYWVARAQEQPPTPITRRWERPLEDRRRALHTEIAILRLGGLSAEEDAKLRQLEAWLKAVDEADGV